LKHENVTDWISFRYFGGRSGDYRTRKRITSKELNEEPYAVKISCTVL